MIEAAVSPVETQQFRILIKSVGTARPSASAAVAKGLGLPASTVIARLYRAPAVLVDGIDEPVAERMAGFLGDIGYEAEVQGMAEKTYKNYVSKFRIFDSWLMKHGFEGNDINYITPDTMREFLLFLINDEELARITVMKYRHMLERMFDWCVKKRYIKFSPMQDLPDTTRKSDRAP